MAFLLAAFLRGVVGVRTGKAKTRTEYSFCSSHPPMTETHKQLRGKAADLTGAGDPIRCPGRNDAGCLPLPPPLTREGGLQSSNGPQ